MNFKKTLFAALLGLGCLSANAQEAKTEYVFNPHWYIQGHVGGQYTLGEVKFKDLISPNAQIGVGYNFNSVLGLRLDVNAWQSKAGQEYLGNTYKWKWNYVNPNLDLTLNLTNAIGGFNPKRIVDVILFGGVGANIAWGNKEALAAKTAIGVDALPKYWDGTKCLFNGKFGLDVDFRITDNFKIGVEVAANTLGDSYNSKKAPNTDWHFDALIGVKYAFGKTYTKKVIPAPEPQIIYKDRIVEKIVEKEVAAKVAPVVVKDPLRIDVFFTIASTKVLGSEAQKINEIAQYLKKHPEAKVTITGYADKGTGNEKINMSLSEKRADIVSSELVKKYGIAENRIVKAAKGDTEQPFDVDVLNRVSICIAE